jgi:3-oxoacyl-[acyl-carrier-protein] synthase II
MRRRVAITGMAGISPIGNKWADIRAYLGSYRNAVMRMPEWSDYDGLNTLLGAPAAPFELSERYTNKATRSMGRVALMATRASELALLEAGLLDDPLLKSGQLGIAYGSSAGTPKAICDFGKMIDEKSTKGINATTYIKMMGHTAPVNLGVFLGITGRIVTTSSACTSGSQGIGYVLGEGAGSLVLENLEHARARGAKIFAEVVGFGTNSDGCHITQPNARTMQIAMELALADAGIPPSSIGYVNAHGTATQHGDVAESQATQQVFGDVPISSLKSYMGHTLGACGALESWISIEMMRAAWFAPTINLARIDPNCADLDYIVGAGRHLECEYVMSNNFAFGGINTSLIFKRYD